MTRVLTAAAGLPLVLGVTWWGPDWLFAGLVALVAALALDEFLAIAAVRGSGRTGRWFLPLGAVVTAAFAGTESSVLGTLTVALLVLMTVTLASPVSSALARVAPAAAGLLYACMLPGFLILLPRGAVLLVLGIVWAGDIGAYYGGRSLGRRRLAPSISPNKTVEGALIGALASLGVGLGLTGILPDAAPESYGSIGMGAVILATAAAGQIGDLAESALKRSAGVKDSGTLLPGHGGMLDRIDSLLFAAPVFFLLTLR
jgi:phosphatidate cytidylyltransferase